MPDPTRLRRHLVDALYADLVGPFAGHEAHDRSRELIRLKPSKWYLTGYLVPEEDREAELDELEGAGEGDDVQSDDGNAEESDSKRIKLFPASMGMSILLPPDPDLTEITATVSFAQYNEEWRKEDHGKGRGKKYWRRVPQPERTITVPLDPETIESGIAHPDLPSVKLKGRLATFDQKTADLELGTRALSLFLVNGQPCEKDDRESKTLFQVQLTLRSDKGFLPRPNRTGEAELGDLDARMMDLHYRDHVEYVVGHNVAAEPLYRERSVYEVRTRWIPRFQVPVVAPATPDDVLLEMEALAALDTPDEVRSALANLPAAYRRWLGEQRDRDLDQHAKRKEVLDELLDQAERACTRIEDGIRLLAESNEVLAAFKLANEAMAMAARKRSPQRYEHSAPAWRLFQLAFLLLNLRGLSEPDHGDRKIVELIFFPTGGGKTEAYLACIALSLVLRRMRGCNEPHGGLGVAVLLRYTLRLLTLDQLERATALICALEVLRRRQPKLLGDTRFSIGLWVGQSATANRFKAFEEQLDDFKKRRRDTSPYPLETCPWCGKPLSANGVELRPTRKKPERVVLRCMNDGECDFANPHPDGLPIAFIDEQIYRELPCFLIATVDKFAMMPWRGETAMLFGRASHVHEGRFFGPLDKPPRGALPLHEGLPPPEVIVQDELHLITGPLGTMVGLYEIPIEVLSSARDGAHPATPKIICATATANHARQQIQALYGRQRQTAIFPPPAVDALETYFSFIDQKVPGRLYVGVAAPGHPLKRILLRTYVSLLCAAKKASQDDAYPEDLRDAFMTLVGYFNSLRELGGMRRLVEDDIRQQASRRSEHIPEEGFGGDWFANREIAEPLELTSREPTGRITETKSRIANPHRDEKTTDVVLASNMISVGVDIERLGLMVVAGQPKTTSEYIQASSRVGRDTKRPGLVVTCFNVSRPRDRSHYEHFVAYHESFYRFVEAQSVTPFAQRALQRGLTGALVAAVRLSEDALTKPDGAAELSDHRKHAERIAATFAERADSSTVKQWALNRLDKWEELARVAKDNAMRLTYSPYDVDRGERKLLHTALEPPIDPIEGEEKFCAPTSMRDVEPAVHIWLSQPGTKRKGSR
jgi:Helicase conserved C-terminal domain